MKKTLLTLFGCLCMTALFADTPPSVALNPVPRSGEKWWAERHAACVEKTKAGGVDLAFLGDSITQGWEGAGRSVWEKHFAGLKAANFGFSGDRTEHVLWRLDNGELVGLSPKLVVIMIGTNNIGHKSSNAAQTAEGVKAIVAKLREKVPGAKILLLGIFPRAEKPTDPMRVAVNEATAKFKEAADGKDVVFLDVADKFLAPDGTLPKEIMPDALHPNTKGYEIWADAILPKVQEMMK